jgi:hypothetical protein
MRIDAVTECYAVTGNITLEESYTSGRYDDEGREVDACTCWEADKFCSGLTSSPRGV